MSKTKYEPITNKVGETQKGQIKVHSRIIKDLSSGIYSSPASCIKELINNSYDADASKVVVRVKPLDETITILDDGIGMNAVEFNNRFAWISKSSKRGDKGEIELSTIFKRPLIGKIGIGFIAVSEICDELEVESSKKGENFKFIASINFKKYLTEDIEFVDPETGEKGLVKGEYDIKKEEEDKEEHYTLIRLKKIKKNVLNIFENKRELSQIAKNLDKKNYETESFNSMLELVQFRKERQKKIRNIENDNEYLKFIYDLSSYLPIEYLENGPISGIKDKIISEIKNQIIKYKFTVDFDGFYLKKPILFTEEDSHIRKVYSFKDEIKNTDVDIKFKGYFYMQHSYISPKEFNGISIKIKGVPIARRYGFETTFMDYPNSADIIFKSWVFCEIYIEKGLENAMNIDRHSFRETHPEYMALQNYIHKLMRTKIFSEIVQKKIYEKNQELNEEKKIEKKQERIEKIKKSSLVTIKYEEPEKIEEKKKNVSKTDTKSPHTKEQKNTFIIPKKETESENKIILNKKYLDSFPKKYRDILEEVLLSFEISIKESKGDIDKLKKKFYELVENSFRR